MDRKLIYLTIFVFILAAFIRGYVLYTLRDFKDQVDLEIYRAGGALVSRGINPYDYNDGKNIREKLRLGSLNAWFRERQGNWNYFTRSNLPFNLIFFGLISKIGGGSNCFRITFSLFDSILSAFIFYFIIRYWKIRNIFWDSLKYLSGLILGAISPILIVWGTFAAEDKGIETLLLLAALFLFLNKNKKIWLYVGTIALGLSIAYKGLGLLLIPLYLYKIYKLRKFPYREYLIFAGILLISNIIWFVPFGNSGLFSMVDRIGRDLGGTPTRASEYLFLKPIIGNYWKSLRFIFVCLYLIILYTVYRSKRIGIMTFIGTLFMVSTVILFDKGGPDRMNIGLTLAIIMFGTEKPINAVLLSILYFMGGLIAMNFRSDESEGYFTLLFTISYLLMLVYIYFRSRIISSKSKSYTDLYLH